MNSPSRNKSAQPDGSAPKHVHQENKDPDELGRYEIYLDRAAAFEAVASRAKKQARILAVARLTTFLLALLVVIFAREYIGGTAWLIAGLAIAAFVISIRGQVRANEEAAYRSSLAGINRDEWKAANGHADVFEGGSEFVRDGHDYAGDLDLFGSRSIYAWLNRAGTLSGRDTLAEWLMRVRTAIPSSDQIKQRQLAVRELAVKLDWRHRFQARARLLQESAEERENLESWMERPIRFHGRPVYRALRFILPGITILCWGLSALGIPFRILGFSFQNLGVVFSLCQLGFAAYHLKATSAEHAGVSRKMALLERYTRLFEAVEEEDFQAADLKAWKSGLGSGDQRASNAMRKLSAVISSFDMRLNMVMGLLLNALLLWDLQCVWKLEEWRLSHRKSALSWFKDLGRFDALTGLGNMHYNNPAFCWPEPSATGPVIDAENLGHPLISSEVRIGNSLRQEPGHLTVITGANMAGKSTFLRAVGVNLVLANLGAPVCADSMRYRPVRVFSSMRTTDSLADGESYFFAELLRLENLVRRLEDGESLFAMIDEMLKGTNSRDQHAGSLALARRIVELDGNGLLATHDLDLGRLADEIPGKVDNRCFEVFTEGERMTFDYRLREGICQNLNATFLMRRMGIMPGKESDRDPGNTSAQA